MIGALRRNLGYKLLSVGIAILLYVVADNQQSPRTTREVFIEPTVVGLPPNLVVKEPPKGRAVTVVGPAPVLDALRAQSIKAFVDLAGAAPGRVRLPITFTFPSGVRPREDQPGYGDAELTLERKATHSYWVEVLGATNPPAGYQYKDPVSAPRTVRVSGREVDMKQVARVVAGLEPSEAPGGAIDREVSLVAEDTDKQIVEGVEIVPPTVRVLVGLKDAPDKRSVLLSLVPGGAPAPGFRLEKYTFVPSSLDLVGPRALMAGRSSLEVRVDVSGLRSSTSRRVVVTPPTGLSVKGPSTVLVHLRIAPESSPLR